MLFIEVNPQPGLVYEKPILREGFFAGQACQIFVFNYLMLTRLHERFLALGSYSYFYNFSTSSLSSSPYTSPIILMEAILHIAALCLSTF